MAPPRRKLRPATGNDPSTGGSGKGFRYPDAKDLFTAAAEGVSNQTLMSLSRGDPEPGERIDLHGIRRDAGARLLSKRLRGASAANLACVVVIHGQGLRSAGGEAVLREALPGWLTGPNCAKYVLAFAPAPDRLGGQGATLVLLRRGG